MLGAFAAALLAFAVWNEWRNRDLLGDQPDPLEGPKGSMIDAAGWGGVFLATGGQPVLCLFPISDPALFATAPPAEVALVLRFEGPGHHLSDAKVKELFDHRAQSTSDPHTVGELELRPIDGGAVEALWPKARAVLGCGIEAIGLHPEVSVLVGTVKPDPVPDLNTLTRLETVVLVEHGDGQQAALGQFFSQMGVHAIVLGRRSDEDRSMLLLVAAETGGDLDLAKGATDEELEKASIGLLLNSRDAALERLAEAADRPVCWFQTGVLRTIQDRPEEAIECMERAATVMPEAWNSIASLRLQLGDREGAIAAAETAISEMPEDPISAQTLADLKSDLDPSEMVHRFSAHTELVLDTARDFISRGEDDSAEALLRRGIQLDPRDSDVHAVLWDLLTRQGRKEEADALLAQASQTLQR